jgi:hypothetical protein
MRPRCAPPAEPARQVSRSLEFADLATGESTDREPVTIARPESPVDDVSGSTASGSPAVADVVDCPFEERGLARPADRPLAAIGALAHVAELPADRGGTDPGCVEGERETDHLRLIGDVRGAGDVAAHREHRGEVDVLPGVAETGVVEDRDDTKPVVASEFCVDEFAESEPGVVCVDLEPFRRQLEVELAVGAVRLLGGTTAC